MQEPKDFHDWADRLCGQLEEAWTARRPVDLATLLGQCPPECRDRVLRELIALDAELRQKAGQRPSVRDHLARFPDQQQAVWAGFHKFDSQVTPPVEDGQPPQEAPVPAGPRAAADPPEDSPMPARLGRYEIVRRLGEGGFGVVYLGHDPELNRDVALKTPRRDRFPTKEDLEAFLKEARLAAQLKKHVGIVAIHDVLIENGLPVIVQEYIDGQDLNHWAATRSLTPVEIARLFVALADPVGHAHEHGLIHRDLKPANILISADGQPHVADFGLALDERLGFRQKGQVAGTYAYMAPEQTRGETHRTEGRADIWAIGVMLYKLLTGRMPFVAPTSHELFAEICTAEPKPPRQINSRVPKELERICLKCLAKHRSDRYGAASDLGGDLQAWLDKTDTGASAPTPAADAVSPAMPQVAVDSGSDSNRPLKIMPKGLRSFDEHDADFFLELLPGPRDRSGLPESIQFWRRRLETTDADETFSVGLLYGPSGCGKSSLVKAGLIPRLAAHVLPIYVEATVADTEARLLKQFRRLMPDLPAEVTLPEAFQRLRQRGVGHHRKVVVILDQFEQWLHGRHKFQADQLTDALRQCDGGRLQTVVLVRDDFYLSVNRLFQELEIRLLEGRNYAVVDLFDCDHSVRVLAAFGRAYGKLPDQLSASQEQFLQQAVTQLANDGKVVSVQLSLLADMMKGRPWTVEALAEVGGVGGVGEDFLEATFSSKSAPPTHRFHQAAARGVLKSLLPAAGTDIKGTMQSRDSLCQAAGYAGRERDFQELLTLLDSELRLITPTDPDGSGEEGASSLESGTGTPDSAPIPPATLDSQLPTPRFYQLTHDYLVPSLRDWLTRKQRETRRGRTELRLAERAAAWNAKRENRSLPSLWEYLNIRALIDTCHWTDGQRAMMGQAARFHGVRCALGAVALVALVAIGMVVRSNVAQQREATRMEGLVGRLLSAEPNQLPAIVRDIDANRELAGSYLAPLLSKPAQTLADKRAQLHARLATVARDPSVVEPLVEELLTGKVTYVIPIREILRPSAATLTERFRDVLRDEKADTQRRFRAALALAGYLPESESDYWTNQDLKFVVEQLVSENSEFQPPLRDALRPMCERLLPDLERIFGNAKASDAQRLGAANALADYAPNDIAKLSQLLTVATREQYAVLYPLVAAGPTTGTVADLSKIAATLPQEDLGSADRIAYGQRRANAAVTLLRLGERENVLPVFNWTDDPEALTQFIFRCRPRGVGVESLLECMQVVSAGPTDRYPSGTRYAILLALGEFTFSEIPERRGESLLKQLADWYGHDPSSGVHGAAGWLLRQWGQAEVATGIDQTAAPYSPDREWFTLSIDVIPRSGAPSDNSLGGPKTKTFYYTFIVFPEGESALGSVADEAERHKDELRHSVKLTRPFAILDREITWEELIAFKAPYSGAMQQQDSQPEAAGAGADWYDAVAFCRWLGEQVGVPESEQAYVSPESLDAAKYPRDANWAPRDWPVDQSLRGFRLPTEAEWEVAARAGARTSYGYGSDESLLWRYAWYTENSGKRAHPPKELRPSLRGLFDLHGNLFEWTHDWYAAFGAEPATDPVGPQGGSYRVVRGGSWSDFATVCRSALRGTYAPTFRTDYRGFRLALTLPEGR